LLEHPRDAAGFTEIATIFCEGSPQVGGSAIAIIGNGFNENGDTAGTVTLIANVF
jgi:hypothetical protein